MISSIPKWVSNLFGNAMKPNVKVLDTGYISPQIKKIRFQGDISNWNFQIGYASVIRVSETAFRNYTVAFHDTQSGMFDIIFHIHNNGIGSRYIDALQQGDELFISQPRGKKMYAQSTKQQFFFGDETALGVACSLLSLLTVRKQPCLFYFELDEVNRDVPALLGLENYMVFPKNNLFTSENWIHDLPLFQTSQWNTFDFALVGNVKSVQTFRKVLKERASVNICSQGYWLEGKKGL